jgi:RNA recognition motif-containing protein
MVVLVEQRKRKVRPEQNSNPGPCPEGCTRLWIGGLPYDATKEDIIQALAEDGEVVSVHISTDKNTNESKGFGHVVFATEKECEDAMNRAARNKGVIVGTQTCRIDYATQRSWEKSRDDKSIGSSHNNSKDQLEPTAPETVHWKKAPTRSRNRGAVENFKGAKMQFDDDSSSDSSSDSDSD